MLVSVLIETSAPICIEKWDDYKMLGRFTLRDEGQLHHFRSKSILMSAAGKTVAIGKVTKLIERSDDMPDVASLNVAAGGV